MTGPTPGATPRRSDNPRNLAIGCLMLPLGFFRGSRVGVLVSMIVAWATKASCDVSGIPSCDWYIYAGVGGLLGALSLPALVLRRLFTSPRPTDTNRS